MKEQSSFINQKTVRFLSVPILLFIVFQILCCKKPKNEASVVGLWELQQLIIDGHDTTEFIKKDSSCFGYTKIGIDKDQNFVQQVYVYPNLFNCYFSGTWFASPGKLSISYNTSPGSYHVGPYLANGYVQWYILEISTSTLKLFVNYNNAPCYLTFKRKS